MAKNSQRNSKNSGNGKVKTNGRWVGERLKRKEDPRLMRGISHYADDLRLGGQAAKRSAVQHTGAVPHEGAAPGQASWPGALGRLIGAPRALTNTSGAPIGPRIANQARSAAAVVFQSGNDRSRRPLP